MYNQLTQLAHTLSQEEARYIANVWTFINQIEESSLEYRKEYAQYIEYEMLHRSNTRPQTYIEFVRDLYI